MGDLPTGLVAGALEAIAAARRAQSVSCVSCEIFVCQLQNGREPPTSVPELNKEGRAPSRGVDVAHVQPIVLPVYARHHVARAAPSVQLAVQQAQLRLARFKRRESESRDEQTASLVKHEQA